MKHMTDTRELVQASPADGAHQLLNVLKLTGVRVCILFQEVNKFCCPRAHISVSVPGGAEQAMHSVKYPR